MKEVITRRWFLKRVIAGLGVGIASALGLQQLTGCSEISEGPVLSPALTEVEGPTPTATLERAPTYTPRPLHEAMFYRTLADDVVQCQVCFRECIVQEGRLGFCHNKKNVGGKYYSYNEPTVFYEQMFDTARLAKEKGLRALFHTNGTMNPEPLFALLEHMDAVTVDLKAFTQQFYEEVSESELEPVLETLQNIKRAGVHLEIVNLVIPTLNDDLDDIRRMCVWIKESLGDEVPLHFTRFSPAYKLTNLPPTPIETLEAAAGIADEEGLQYVYVGNVPGHARNSTFCPQCGKAIISRIHFSVLSLDVEHGKCRFCGHEVPGIW